MEQASMKHSVPHDLGQQRAKEVTEQALQAYRKKFAQYNPGGKWTGPNTATISFSVKGMHFNGVLEVLKDRIEMDMDVPFLLRPLKGRALKIIEGEIKEWIAKAKSRKT
jgi:hypothetical protein